MKYILLEGYLAPYGSAVKNIEERIQSHLDAGFELHGNIIHIKENKYAQAMIFKEPPCN